MPEIVVEGTCGAATKVVAAGLGGYRRHMAGSAPNAGTSSFQVPSFDPRPGDPTCGRVADFPAAGIVWYCFETRLDRV